MAKDRGWWELKTTVELDEIDREHIADLIIRGHSGGVVCKTDLQFNPKEDDVCCRRPEHADC
jgi:hypothetical protein